MQSSTPFLRLFFCARIVGNAGKNPVTGKLEARPLFFDPGKRDRPPLGNGGLFSTAPDYGRFARMTTGRLASLVRSKGER